MASSNDGGGDEQIGTVADRGHRFVRRKKSARNFLRLLYFSYSGRSAVRMPARDKQEVVIFGVHLVDGEIDVLEDIAVLPRDFLFRRCRHVNRDTFFHEAKVGIEELEILE